MSHNDILDHDAAHNAPPHRGQEDFSMDTFSSRIVRGPEGWWVIIYRNGIEETRGVCDDLEAAQHDAIAVVEWYKIATGGKRFCH